MLLANWEILGLAFLLGVGIYLIAMLAFYVLGYDDVLLPTDEEDALAGFFLRCVNPIRESIGLCPIWQVPRSDEEKETVRIATDWLYHVERGLDRNRPLHGRAASNKVLLRRLARTLVGDMVDALWSLHWSREMRQRLERIDREAVKARVSEMQQAEQRDLDRMNRSFDSLSSLATEMLELGSQVKDSDVERLLARFRETVAQLEEDTEALEEVRKITLE